MPNKDRQLSLFGEPDEFLDEIEPSTKEPHHHPIVEEGEENPLLPFEEEFLNSIHKRGRTVSDRTSNSIFDDDDGDIFVRRNFFSYNFSDYPTFGGLDLKKAKNVRYSYDRLDAVALHYDLEQRLGLPVDLTLTNNRRRLFSVFGKKYRVQFRLHYLFVYAPEEVVTGIEKMGRGNPDGREIVQKYIDSLAPYVEEKSLPPIKSKGSFFDLEVLLNEAISEAQTLGIAKIKDENPPKITWGRESRGRRSIRYGSYSVTENLIRVHPRLDQSWVPRFFVAYVVFHEYLHHLIPPEIVDGRRNVHSETFNRAERRFYDYERAVNWESENVSAILES